MSGRFQSRERGVVRSYLGFLDRSVLFRKPISCFFTVISFLIPLTFLVQFIQQRDFLFENPGLLLAWILILLVLTFAGIFGALIWWHRRIIRDEGPRIYDNFRRFLQTLSEWTGTVFAIIVFGCVTVITFLLKEEINTITSLIPFELPLPVIDFSFALFGLAGGFLIILASKILLFLLDLLVLLFLKIWKLIIRIVLYYYRCIVKVHSTIELNTTVWIGLVWLLAAAVVILGLVMCYKLMGAGFRLYLPGIITLALGLGFMAFMVVKRKND